MRPPSIVGCWLFVEWEPPRRRRRVELPQPVVNGDIVVSSDTSTEDIGAPMPAQPVVIDLDSSIESLTNIDPRPEWQLPVEPLHDLGPLDVTAECLPPPLQHRVLQEAYVLLQRLQLPQLQCITPQPEQPARQPTPPPDQEVDWVEVEAAVAEFNGQRYFWCRSHLPCSSRRWSQYQSTHPLILWSHRRCNR